MTAIGSNTSVVAQAGSGANSGSVSAGNGVPSSYTLWSPHDTIKDVADSLGLTSNHWNEEVAKSLAMDVEYRIHEIIEQATKFMRHAKRKILTTQDIDKAMKVLNLEPLYGYDNSKPAVFKEALIGPNQTLYYIEDEELDFETFINQPLPPVPRYTNCTCHWLAVEGIQPTIPQNPNLNDIKSIPYNIRGTMDNYLSLNNDDIQLTTSKTGLTTVEKPSLTKKDLDVKPLVKHVLSKELQLYFNKCIEILTKDSDDPDDPTKLAVLTSIQIDPGLHQLVPYFIQFIAETITHNLKNLNLLKIITKLIDSLLRNSTLFLDPYIHALMPCILTLLLAKTIGNEESKANEQEEEESFIIRKISLNLLQSILKKYTNSYQSLKPRLTRTILRAMLSPSTKKSLGTQFGVLLTLNEMGNEVIRVIFLGNVKVWFDDVVNQLSDQDLKHKDKMIKEVLNLLRSLANEAKLVKSNGKRLRDDETEERKTEEEFTDEMKDKLKLKLGDTLGEIVLNEKDSLDIYNGIFLGEI